MSTPTERYALLIRQLGAELSHIRGWKRRVAERLGVHPSYVSRILSGEKLTIGPDVLDRACDRVGLDPGFFFSDQQDEPHYRDFRTHSNTAKGVTLQVAEHILCDPDAELDAIAAIAELDEEAWRRVRTWADSYHSTNENDVVGDEAIGRAVERLDLDFSDFQSDSDDWGQHHDSIRHSQAVIGVMERPAGEEEE